MRAEAGCGRKRADQVERRGRGDALGRSQPRHATRTVGTLVAHSAGLDAARDVLGHRDPSVTARHYIADAGRVIDVRHTLAPIYA